MSVPVPVPMRMSELEPELAPTPIPKSVLQLSVPLAGEPERETDFRSCCASLEPTAKEFQGLRVIRYGTPFRC